MITMVEPQPHITALWGKPQIVTQDNYRMMRYVLKVEHNGKVCLHNVVTGQLTVLDQDEATLLDKIPTRYELVMKQLVEEHYVVPVHFDEHQQVVKMREVLRKLEAIQKRGDITTYTILPTTACNARCYYCFEQGVKTVTMTEKTANDVADFISTHCGDKRKVSISWFGGEPTVAAHRIDQICEGLKRKEIDYWSDMTTNGYLFDEKLADRAVSLWNLKSVMISLDGTESNYNRIKAYVSAKDNPYQRVFRNIGLLLERNVEVNLRMNYDQGNYCDFQDLVKEFSERYKENQYLHVRAHPINGTYTDADGVTLHGSDEWFDRTTVELNNIARAAGFTKSTIALPCLRYEGCEANSSSAVTITADGRLVRCCEQFGDEQTTGDIWNGITHPERIESWKKFDDFEKCFGCVLYPRCNRLVNCSSGDRCNYYSEITYLTRETIKQIVSTKEAAGIFEE